MEAVSVSDAWSFFCMVQFWGMKEDCCCLTTVDQPFAVSGHLYKGYSWYRKLCEANQYSLKEEAINEESVGTVGRAYMNGKCESTPDLRLYSIQEFPLRDQAAQYGLRTYLACPVFDLHTQKCYGVLEIVSTRISQFSIFPILDRVLKVAELRSTHIGFAYISDQPETEIAKMMESAMTLVPQLQLVQVWSPCKQCVVNTSNNLSCMQRVAFVHSKDMSLDRCYRDLVILMYHKACEFHHLRIEEWLGGPPMRAHQKSCFCRNLCDFSICENRLAHYAQRARLSFCFVVHLQNVHRSSDNNYLVEFFFQSNSTEDASFLHLLLKIMEMELINFKFEKSIFELKKTSTDTRYEYVEWKHQHSRAEEGNMLTVMKGNRSGTYSLLKFEKYFDKSDLSCLQPYKKDEQGWLFDREEMSNNGVNNYTSLQEKIKKLMTEIANTLLWIPFSLVQFWAVGLMDEGRPCLQTSDQPFALRSLDRGLALFRKKCMEHHYFVDEQVGPLQRVFRSGLPEIYPELRLYSTTEFPLRDRALRCRLIRYVCCFCWEIV